MARVFVAVRLPAELTGSIAGVQRELDRQLVDVKWVERENLHLTLRFFGEMAGEEITEIEKVLTKVSGLTTAFTVELGGIGSFPPRGRPRVIWVGITAGGERLTALAGSLEQEFIAHGLGGADRPFSPHLTLGRVRDPNTGSRGRRRQRERIPPQAAEPMRAAVAAAGYGPACFAVREVALVESRLLPRGPEYRDRLVAPLAGEGGEVGES